MLFSQPLSAPQSRSSPQYSGWDKKEVSLFGSFLHSRGYRVLTLMLSLTPGGDITGWEVSPGTEQCHLGGGLMQVKWSYSSCALQCVQIADSFAPTVCWNFSTGLPDFHKATVIHRWVSKLLFFESKIVENFLCHLDDITQNNISVNGPKLETTQMSTKRE